jgi:hypothetical protein
MRDVSDVWLSSDPLVEEDMPTVPWESRDPVKKLRKLLTGKLSDFGGLDRLLREVIQKKTWKLTDAEGSQLDFANFVVARPGLGIRTLEKIKPLLEALKRLRLYEEFLDVLALVSRPRGAPQKKNLTNGEVFDPFYTPSRSPTSLDKLLPQLRKHAIWERIVARELSPTAAARQVGIITDGKHYGRYLGCYDPKKAMKLSAEAKALLLRNIWQHLGLEAQLQMLRTLLEPVLGAGVSEKWHTHAHATNGITPNEA